jgi:hypothetical protein
MKAALLWIGAALAASVSLLALTTAARADAIDGDWCFEAASLTIRGPAIRTPGGTQMTGDYDRHGFSYQAPAGEEPAGTEVVMRLHGEELMSLVKRTGMSATQPQMWRRCKPVS